VTPCRNDKAGEYQCNNINLISFLSHEDVGSANKVGNDIWGWMSKRSGRELSIIGQTDGVAFVELKKDGSLVYLCRLPTQTDVVSWRDIKVIKDHAYISSEANGHGLQILDLNKLLNVKKPKVFSKETDITLYTGFGASHNIVAHEEIDLIYAVGDRSGANAHLTTCAGGFFMVDVSDPKTPFPPSRVGQDGYVHDAQCVIYKGPSKKYRNREICFAFHEDTLTVMDMTNKKDPIVGSRTLTLGTPTDTRAGLLTSPWLYQHWSLPEPSPLYRP
jgi:choice-of-anchor B domain-containing protein